MSSPNSTSTPPPDTGEAAGLLVKKLLNFSSAEAQRFVIIIVGKTPTKVEFRIHKHVITYYSPDFFGKASNSAMKEGQTQSMELDDVNIQIFGNFNKWLYTQKLQNEDGVALSPVELRSCGLLDSASLYSTSKTNCTPSILSELQNYAYLEAPEDEGSALRKIVLSLTLHFTNTTNVDEVLVGLPHNMILEFAKALVVHQARLSAKLQLFLQRH
ncbi:hypothetical protein N431DRAFT_452943 [Stipitochalara longipes BDJ]|nr:hypothetical protein N431DRAFT_452943 [Stipitochalara longipes BDJ]